MSYKEHSPTSTKTITSTNKRIYCQRRFVFNTMHQELANKDKKTRGVSHINTPSANVA